jgi:hypothetical protein
MAKKAMYFSLKAFAIWLTILIVSICGSFVLPIDTTLISNDGPLSSEQAFLVVNAIHAMFLSVLAERAVARGIHLILLLSITLFFAQSFLLAMEAWYFADNLKISVMTISMGVAQTALIAIAVGLIATLLWRSPQQDTVSLPKLTKELCIKLLIVGVLYIFAYFIAGYFIAWAEIDLQAYYGFGTEINNVELMTFQFLRGFMWGMLALFITAYLKGKTIEQALLVGSIFSVFATAQLLYPNPFMPWNIRLTHMIEVGTSNFIFGMLAIVVLCWNISGHPDRHIQTKNSGSISTS